MLKVPLNLWPEQKRQVVPTIELVMFEVAQLNFGIPMTKVNRVISNVFIGEDFSLTQDVKILDLHHRLSGIEISNPNAIAIFTGTDRQLYGIPIETAPTLISIPLDRIRTIPNDVRQSNPLGIANHIAMISTENTELTIFILS
jgi:chemotaxis signal transduction protein